ncbi:nucleoside triphosphate pyrophosphohydrolase [Aneurinibacillus sp. UBA3580]|jgi:predicted house-cleaning noncanonical NTP pyrophosphatase (MazG superfamily)|uniref:nucleoside triphosphate pyrophosphohydrolase n=1 Tax=Aneurinibacillus sp. UBA3580 TaxID=1946041 RepID=UPI00257C7D94|nr:nucleoside triphosphate pyrophosphohydrolase [Aneurinibacillus sp. UBA3580]
MPTYNKLVRDLIPDIITRTGKTCITHKVEGRAYETALRKKLLEEIKEYIQAQTNEQAKEELAAVHDSSTEEIEAIRAQKAEERGRFTRGIVLFEVKE